MQNTKIPDEALFFVADGYYSTNQLLRILYTNPSEQTRNHFLSVNSHLSAGRVNPGQMVIITPPNAHSCQQWEVIMQEAAMQVDAELAQLTEQERKSLARNYALLSNVTTYTSPMYGWANNYFKQRVKQVEQILQQIDRLYISTYQKNGHLHSNQFFSQRKALFLQLNQAINGMMGRELFGQSVPANRLKNQLGMSTSSILHQWKMQGTVDGIKGFSSNYQKLTRAAKVFSRLGYVSIGLDIVGGVTNIQRACNLKPESEACKRTTFSESGKVAGSIGGGLLGGTGAAYITCNLLFGAETLGSSLLWCSVVAGAVGGYAGSKAIGTVGEYAGEEVYKVTIQ